MAEAWQRFRRDRLALGALGVILLLVAVALGAPFLAPYDPSQQFFDGLTLRGRAAAPQRALLARAPISWAAICSRASSSAPAPR